MNGGSVFISHDAGANWTERKASVSQNWSCIDVPADGGLLRRYLRADGTFNSLAQPAAQLWRSVAVSADGMAIAVSGDGSLLAYSDGACVFLYDRSTAE